MFKPELKCFSEQGPQQPNDPIRAGGLSFQALIAMGLSKEWPEKEREIQLAL